MPRKVRWGVLGVASIAVRRAVPGMQKGQWSEITAIASRDKNKAEEAARLMQDVARMTQRVDNVSDTKLGPGSSMSSTN